MFLRRFPNVISLPLPMQHSDPTEVAHFSTIPVTLSCTKHPMLDGALAKEFHQWRSIFLKSHWMKKLYFFTSNTSLYFCNWIQSLDATLVSLFILGKGMSFLVQVRDGRSLEVLDLNGSPVSFRADSSMGRVEAMGGRVNPGVAVGTHREAVGSAGVLGPCPATLLASWF